MTAVHCASDAERFFAASSQVRKFYGPTMTEQQRDEVEEGLLTIDLILHYADDEKIARLCRDTLAQFPLPGLSITSTDGSVGGVLRG